MRKSAGVEEPSRSNESPNISMATYAYRALTSMIMGRVLRGGDRLIEQTLAGELAISRTPLREAMQRLEGEGLLVKTNNRSYVVRTVDMREYLQSLRVRKILEAEAAVLAIGKFHKNDLLAARASLVALRRMDSYDPTRHWESDDLVHDLFIDACGNNVLTNILRGLRITTRLFEVAQLADRLDPDSREHDAILEALEKGDSDAVRQATAFHIQSLFDFAVETIS